MKYGLFSGCLWGLDTVILGIALTMVPFIGTAEALALGAIVSSALHDVCCALWLLLYMGVRGRLKDTLAALKTRSGKVVILGALLGGPIGMTGYVIAINNIGAGYTAIISSFYPAFGTLMAVLLLKEKITPGRVVALIVALAGIIAMGYLSADTTVTGDPDHRTSGSSRRCVRLGQRGGAVRLGHARRRRGQRDRPADPRNHVGPRVPHR